MDVSYPSFRAFQKRKDPLTGKDFQYDGLTGEFREKPACCRQRQGTIPEIVFYLGNRRCPDFAVWRFYDEGETLPPCMSVQVGNEEDSTEDRRTSNQRCNYGAGSQWGTLRPNTEPFTTQFKHTERFTAKTDRSRPKKRIKFNCPIEFSQFFASLHPHNSTTQEGFLQHHFYVELFGGVLPDKFEPVSTRTAILFTNSRRDRATQPERRHGSV